MINKTGTLCLIQPHAKSENQSRHDLLTEAITSLGVDLSSKERLLATLPFVASDATGGSEIELQVAVKGHRDQVDLPLIIEASNYFANLLKRARSGDNSEQLISGLQDFLNKQPRTSGRTAAAGSRLTACILTRAKFSRPTCWPTSAIRLVVLPKFSSTSLAKDGVHVSTGSRRLGGLRQDLSGAMQICRATSGRHSTATGPAPSSCSCPTRLVPLQDGSLQPRSP